MMGKSLLFGLIMLLSASLSPVFGTAEANNTDSVNIKQIILSQIESARAKANENKQILSADEASGTKNEREVQSVSTSAGISEGLFLKIFILVDAALSVFLFVLWRRRKLKSNMAEKKQLKNNIMKLRQEKVGRKSDSVLDSNRKKIRLEPAFASGTASNDLFVRHAKKMSVSVGELQLAAKIKSYEKARG